MIITNSAMVPPRPGSVNATPPPKKPAGAAVWNHWEGKAEAEDAGGSNVSEEGEDVVCGCGEEGLEGCVLLCCGWVL